MKSFLTLLPFFGSLVSASPYVPGTFAPSLPCDCPLVNCINTDAAALCRCINDSEILCKRRCQSHVANIQPCPLPLNPFVTPLPAFSDVILPFPVPETAIPSIVTDLPAFVTDLPAFITDLPSVVTDVASVVGAIPSIVTDIAAYLPPAVPSIPSPQLPPILPFPDPNGILAPILGCECEQVFCIQSFPASCYCAAAAALSCFQKCGGPRPPPANCDLLAGPGGLYDGPVKARSAAPEPQDAPLPAADEPLPSIPLAPQPPVAPGDVPEQAFSPDVIPLVLNAAGPIDVPPTGSVDSTTIGPVDSPIVGPVDGPAIGPDTAGITAVDFPPVFSLPANAGEPAPLPPPILLDSPFAGPPIPLTAQPGVFEPPVAPLPVPDTAQPDVGQPIPLESQPIPISAPVPIDAQPVPIDTQPIPIFAPGPDPIPIDAQPIPIIAPAPIPISAPIPITAPINIKPRPGCECAPRACTQVYPQSCTCANDNALRCFYRCGGARPTLQSCPSSFQPNRPPPAPRPIKNPRPLPIAKDIFPHRSCGGFRIRSNECPRGYVCIDDPYKSGCGLACDQPGICVRDKLCGGFAGFRCDYPGQVCVDNPNDDCDPKNGGADCGGLCVWPHGPL